MDDVERAVWFVGDRDDPCVAEIADAVADSARRVSYFGTWPDAMEAGAASLSTLVLHRPALTPPDAERLSKLRAGPAGPRVILCVGPNARYAEMERWLPLVDVILPEATACETIARHLALGGSAREARPQSPRPRVTVVSSNYELRQTLVEACESGGYTATAMASWVEASSSGLALWDVPVLEATWPATLSRRARVGAVVALLGFSDRALVRQARGHGAAACLDLPCDLADLLFVLDRLAASRGEPAHEVPPPPAGLRRSPRLVAEAGPGAYN